MSHFQAKTHPVTHARAKKGVNVYLTEALVREAKEMHLNISATLEDALAAAVRAKKMQRWKEDNKAGIQHLMNFSRTREILPMMMNMGLSSVAIFRL